MFVWGTARVTGANCAEYACLSQFLDAQSRTFDLREELTQQNHVGWEIGASAKH